MKYLLLALPKISDFSALAKISASFCSLATAHDCCRLIHTSMKRS